MRRWLTLILLLPLIAWQASEGEALLDAARNGDRAAVERLLDAGVDVDHPDRYGSTALAFAARAGHLEIVQLLLERGASAAIVDRFYGMSAVSRALQEGHRDVALLLLRSGATDGIGAIMIAIRDDDPELAEAAVAAAPLPAAARDELLGEAQEAGREQIAALLREASIDDTAMPLLEELPLQAYVGAYRSEEPPLLLHVEERGDSLALRLEDGTEHPLRAEGGRLFRSTQDQELAIGFGGRGAGVEFARLQQGDTFIGLRPLEAEEAALLLGEHPAVTAAAVDAPRASTPNWPAFRGPAGSGVSDGHGVPVTWDVATGQNVAWKTPLPGLANSSPVVWGDRVFVTTAVRAGGDDDAVRIGLYGDVEPVDDLTEHEFKVYALDRRDGSVVWERTVFAGAPQVKRHPKSSQANSSPVTDGEHVVVLFGSVGMLACFDLDGRQLWQQDIGALDAGWFYDPDYQWGHAASPVIYDDLVIVQADVQRDPFIAAYELGSGRQVWRTSRQGEIPTFSTPALFRGRPRDELITNGTMIRAYDPRSGEELWQLGPNSEVVVASPITSDEMIYVTAGYPPVRPIYAVRPGGSGDISLPAGSETNESVLWSKDRGGVYIPSPLLYRGLLYTANNDGRMTAYDAATGAMVLRARIGGTGGSFVASPVAADGHLYLGSEDGTFFVLRAGTEYEEVARIEMDEVVWATPAITPGLLIVRTLGHVYGIGTAR